MSKEVEVTAAPAAQALTQAESVMSDLTIAGEDSLRLGAALVTFTSRSASLTVRTSVVAVETVNVGLGLALEVMPRSYEETESALLSLFEPVKDDTVDAAVAA